MSTPETIAQPVGGLVDPIGERLEEEIHRNFWLDAPAAQRHGPVSRIIERAGDLSGDAGRPAT